MKIRRTTGRGGGGISFLGINQYCEGYSVSSLNCGNSTLVERLAVVVVVFFGNGVGGGVGCGGSVGVGGSGGGGVANNNNISFITK